jgi:hypothetical protein
MSGSQVGWLTDRVSSVLAYIAAGIGAPSQSTSERSLKLASVGWAFAAGGYTPPVARGSSMVWRLDLCGRTSR